MTALDPAEWQAFIPGSLPVGMYRWRISHRRLEGLRVIFNAEVRMRGNGYNDPIASPSFDYWDGYRVHLPGDAEWSALLEPTKQENIEIEGASSLPCPYCKRVPTLTGHQRASDGRGIVLCYDPTYYNSWKLECCSWASTPTYKDPRDLIATRNGALTAAGFTISREGEAAVRDVIAERRRHIEAEGWTPEHDDKHVGGELAKAAACYAMGRRFLDATMRPTWPWAIEWWKPKGRRSDLIRAAALLVAEIERLDRAMLSARPKP